VLLIYCKLLSLVTIIQALLKSGRLAAVAGREWFGGSLQRDLSICFFFSGA